MADTAELTRDQAVANYHRDEHGLLKNVNYIFDERGAVDWRKMVSNEFLYPNRGWFEDKGKEAPKSIEGLEDNQLLIKLGGIRELAKIRGFDNVKFSVVKTEEEEACVVCEMDFTPNYENPNGVHYSEVANATINNCNGFSIKFLESIAANRAFIRCVRGFLNINIVGADEIDTSPKEGNESKKAVTSKSFTPQGSLEKKAEELGYEDYTAFKAKLKDLWKADIYKNEDVVNWKDFADVPAKEARKLLGILNKKE